MKLNQQVRLPLSPQQAWVALNDVDVLQACIPGCKRFRSVGAEEFDIAVAVPFGPVDMSFQGKIRLCDVDPARSYTLRFADATGRSRAEARIRLEAKGRDETLLHYSASIALRGWLARFGAPLCTAVALQLAEDFFRKFRQRAVGQSERMHHHRASSHASSRAPRK